MMVISSRCSRIDVESMLKVNHDKTKFIIFGSHAQLTKLDPYLPARIFGYFMHPAVVVMNMLLILFSTFVGHARFKCVTSGGLDSA